MQDIKLSLTGMGEETGLTRSIVKAEIERNVSRWRRFSRVNLINIDVRRSAKGGRVNYTVRIEATGEGSHHADSDGWSLETAMHEALERLGKEIVRTKERKRTA